MNEKDDLDLFVQQLEAALVSPDIPRDKWTKYLLTVDVNQKVMHLLQDRDSTYDKIRAALMECSAMLFAVTAEAVFSPVRGNGEHINPRQIAD